MDGKNTAERQLLARIVEKFRQSERRIGKVQGSVRPIHQVVRAVEPLTFVLVCKHGQRSVFFEPRYAVVAMLIDRQAVLGIERQAIRPRLAVLRNIRAGITAGSAKYRQLAQPILDARFEFRSEEHTSELQSRRDLVCRLLLE